MNSKLCEGSSSSNHEDSNANLNNEMNVSKGAIPKTKNYSKNSQNGKKNAKLNNNIENITSPNNDSAGLCKNGFSKCIGNTFFNKSVSLEKRISDWDNKESSVSQDIYLNNDSDSSSSDDNDLSVSDDGCIYTYKADSIPDLPDLFNNLDVPLLDNEPNEGRENTSSPEMDFLEMDFDPEPSGETETEQIATVQTDQSSESNLDDNTFLDLQPPCSSKNANNSDSPDSQKPSEKTSSFESMHNEEIILLAKPHLKKVRNEIKMPWSCTLHQRTKASKQLRIMKADMSTVVEELSTPMKIFESGLEHEEEDERIMIWSDQEAYVKQITQIGPPSCGATAILNVLIALRLPIPSLDIICDCVKSKTRSEPDLLPYLLSRSKEGSGHREIISGLHKATNGRIYARFFSMYPERCVNIYDWLSFWIKHGAIPVATLNIQKSEEPIPDSWYHQMVYGIDPNNMYLTNPLECVNTNVLWHQLVSESVLLVRREDVICRFNGRTALEKLQVFKDSDFDEINVLGQVAKVIRENSRLQRENSHITSHIKIPTDCRSGITLAIDRNSKAYPLLLECPELPLLNLNNCKQ